ncbi:MAG: 30S ribosomal protein S5 [Parcubacteria group bacterium]|nr:30S ribosomal protein S5 [Parcubacteria group bacterium]
MAGKQFQQRTRREARTKSTQEYDHRVISIDRVTRVVKGGRRFRFRALVAVGDRHGTVGLGVAKGQDVSGAITKAIHAAQKHTIRIPLVGGTIPHEMESKYHSARVLMRPSSKGTGLIAGGAVRIVCDMGGIHDISAKVLSRSGNKLNVARATIRALMSLEPPKVVPPTPDVSAVPPENVVEART